jgi:hypothetical protein
MAPDIMGQLSFTDDQGDPETSVDISSLAAGFDGLDALIASFPDGTQLTIQGGSVMPPLYEVNFVVTINSGAVDNVDGSASSQATDCQSNIGFLGAELADLGGVYPASLVANISVTTVDGAIQGTVTFDGTNQATVEVTLDGGATTFTFNVDLDTGAVTPA